MVHYIIKIYRFLKHSLQILFAPPNCIVCGVLWPYVCTHHEKYLKGYPSWCITCLQPTLHSQQCIMHPSSYRWIIVWFYYTRIIKHLIYNAKYSWSYHIFSYLATKIILHIKANPFLIEAQNAWTLLITHIPMHPRKEHYRRWYNQASILAEYIAKELWAPHREIITRTTHTFSQVYKTRLQRQKTKSPFTWWQEDISPYTTILVVDDILTTWTTISHACTCIKHYYPNNDIRWICIARNI